MDRTLENYYKAIGLDSDLDLEYEFRQYALDNMKNNVDILSRLSKNISEKKITIESTPAGESWLYEAYMRSKNNG